MKESDRRQVVKTIPIYSNISQQSKKKLVNIFHV